MSGGASDRAGGPGAGSPPVTGLAHVAIAVRDAGPLATTLAAALGGEPAGEELLDGGNLRVVFVRVGPVLFELLEPRGREHTVARFLERRGPGLHHVSLEVADLEAALARCRDNGVTPIDATPRKGAHDSQIAFLDPRSLGGVLIELCRAGSGTGHRSP